MADSNSLLYPTVEQVLADAKKGRPEPLIKCSVEEAIEVWGADFNTEMDVTDIDGWELGEQLGAPE